MPLNILPGLSFWQIVFNIFELVLHVGGPGDLILFNFDWLCFSSFVECEGVIENTLGDEAARECGLIHVEVLAGEGFLAAQVLVALDGVAVVELVHLKPVAHELGVGA